MHPQPPDGSHTPGPPPAKKRRIWPWVVGGVLLLLIVVGSIAKPSAPVATTPNPATEVSTPAVVSTPAAVPASAAPSAPAVGTAASWTMPSLVGRNLQDAQDAIQALTGNTIFFTKSHDATGAGRHQILDRDWKVCSQNVKPGAKITSDTAIDFGAAKLGERC